MGLDNGIEIYHKGSDASEEICYWRKCWGIRRDILHIVRPSMNLDQYDFTLTSVDVDKIIALLEEYDNEEYWTEWAESIWTYEEYQPVLQDQIKALKQLQEKLKDPTNDIERVSFYDSY